LRCHTEGPISTTLYEILAEPVSALFKGLLIFDHGDIGPSYQQNDH
jgi:hypothetical protein